MHMVVQYAAKSSWLHFVCFYSSFPSAWYARAGNFTSIIHDPCLGSQIHFARYRVRGKWQRQRHKINNSARNRHIHGHKRKFRGATYAH